MHASVKVNVAQLKEPRPTIASSSWLRKRVNLLREQERLLEKRLDAADMVLYDSRSQLISVLIRELTVESEPGI